MPPDELQAAFMVGGVARLALAAIFSLSAAAALRDGPAHAAIVEQYRLLPPWAVPAAARGLPALSLAAALLLLLPATVGAGALLGEALLAAFTTAIGINLARGREHIDCGCGGAGGQSLSAGRVVRNLLLMALLAAALAAPARGRIDWGAVTGILGGGCGLVAIYFAASQLLANRRLLTGLET